MTPTTAAVTEPRQDRFWRAEPPPDLAPYVEAFLGRQAVTAHAGFEVFPGVHAELLFHFADPFLASTGLVSPPRPLARATLLGPRTERCRQQAGPAIEWVIVQLTPAGCRRFLDQPFAALIDRDAPLAALIPDADDQWARLAAVPDFAYRVAATVAWLRRRPAHRAGDLALSRLAMLTRTRPCAAGQLAAALECGERRARQRFAAELGIAPKAWLSLMRANRHLQLLHPAAAGGAFEYADDSHAIREFKRFAGLTPGAYRRIKAAGDPLVNTGLAQPV